MRRGENSVERRGKVERERQTDRQRDRETETETERQRDKKKVEMEREPSLCIKKINKMIRKIL